MEYSEAMAAFFVPRQQGTPLPAAVAEGSAALEAPQTAAAVRQRTRRSGRVRASAAVRAPWWHHFPGEGAPGRNHDQGPVTGADREGLSVSPFKNAQHVGHLLGVTRSWRAPPDHDPPADVGGCQPDVKPVAHTIHPVPAAGDAARRDGMNIGPPPSRHLASRSGCGGHGGCRGVRDERKFSIRPVTFPVSARARGGYRPVAY